MKNQQRGPGRFGLFPEEFDHIWRIMLEAFPPEERRNRQGMEAILDDPLFRLLYRRDAQGCPAAFLTYWELDGMRYVEHFAVSSSLRGHGMGSLLLKEFMGQDTTPVILEVEPPETQTARRRIDFYKRLGFCLNDYPYLQPPLQPGMPSIPLQLMSAPGPLSPTEFQTAREELYTKVYRRRPTMSNRLNGAGEESRPEKSDGNH